MAKASLKVPFPSPRNNAAATQMQRHQRGKAARLKLQRQERAAWTQVRNEQGQREGARLATAARVLSEEKATKAEKVAQRHEEAQALICARLLAAANGSEGNADYARALPALDHPDRMIEAPTGRTALHLAVSINLPGCVAC